MISQVVVFPLSILISLVSWFLVFEVFFRKGQIVQPTRTNFQILLSAHLFRFMPLAFLIPGISSATSFLEAGFLNRLIVGDVSAAVFALLMIIALMRMERVPFLLLLLFNIFGLLDFALAVVGLAPTLLGDPSMMDGLFYILLAGLVPMAIVSHFYMFSMLVRLKKS